MAVSASFRTGPSPSSAESDVIVVHCSDARFQPHFQEFLKQGLGVERYFLLAVPGGPQFLTLTEYLPKFSWVGWRWLKFMADQSKPRRVVLIGHGDCRWYFHQRFFHVHESLPERQLADLRQVRAMFVERFPAVAVETYFATLDGEHADFETVG